MFHKLKKKPKKKPHSIKDYNRTGFCFKSIDNVWFTVIFKA